MDNPLMIYYAHRPLQFYKHMISMSLLHTDLTDLTDLPMLRMAHG